MSFEGYIEYLCAAGHYRGGSVWDEPSGEFVLCSCGQPYVWRRTVDETNGSHPDEPWTLPYPLQVKVPAKVERCNLGHLHVIEEVRYEIPTDAGTRLEK